MASNKQEWFDAFKHLRLHFSLLLLPVFLFALSQVHIFLYDVNSTSLRYIYTTLLTFAILHLLVYPASNIFNSFYDIDQGSVGGLKNPPPPNVKMLWLANGLDSSALFSSLLLSPTFTVFLTCYILASRLYSYRPIRLKKYPITGFLVIFIFQGAVTYYLSIVGILSHSSTSDFGLLNILSSEYIFAILATSFQIGAIYPLTQIYQHKSDLADSVTTLSYKLGYRGTFIFSGIMFSIATLCYYFHFKERDIESFYILMIAQIPIVLYFLFWASKVWKNTSFADYKHTMQMNVIAAVVLNFFFIYLLIK